MTVNTQHFVYMWMDRARNMFYVGSHSGQFNDGYLSSSRWLAGEIRYRPTDFKRRVLSIHPSQSEALQEEHRLLRLIRDCEFGVKYYNQRSGREKGVTAHNKGIPMSEEQKAKISAAKQGKTSPTKGRKMLNRAGDNNVMKNPENRNKMAKIATGRKMATREDGSRYWTYPEKQTG